MINLRTLNYLLAVIQICTQLDAARAEWDQLQHYLDKLGFSGAAMQYRFDDLERLVRHLIKPFGTAHGSEESGARRAENRMRPVGSSESR